MESPILFRAPMVRALLEHRKTQTRRIVKNLFDYGADRMKVSPIEDEFLLEKWPEQERSISNFGRCERIKCPYGKPDDRLWVRETWLPCCHGSYEAWPRNGGTPVDAQQAFIQYKEDAPIDDYKSFWRSPIFMPRWASRITLEITEVRVQRLQEISGEDCLAEGVSLLKTNCDGECGATPCQITRQPYISLWNSINGVGSWDANPWVWAVTFKEVA